MNTWYEFFEELATKIYEKYKVNKTNIPACIQDFTNSIRKLDSEFYKREGKHMNFDSENKIIEVDPFSLFSHLSFRKGTQWLFDFIKDYYSLKTSIDTDDKTTFDGMPTPNFGNICYYPWESNRKLTDISVLWELFFASIEYAENPINMTRISNFKNCLVSALNVKQVGIDKMSDGLLWIRPHFYVSVNGINRPYIQKKYRLFLDKKNINGDMMVDTYLHVLNEIKRVSNFKENQNIMIDISREAYISGKPNKKQSASSIFNKNQDVCSSISSKKNSAYNKIFYGVPGCGKSYHIEHNVLDEIFQDCRDKKEKNTFRTIFYQDYSHADFVGQYMPKRINGQVEYTFVPKVFTKALERAYQCPNEPIVLIIEEINRGDAASIFGDVFQLLDRDKNGKSEYKIDCDEISDYLETKGIEKEKIYLPANLYLLATMNTCDQNVFALDTAFKRRWDMEEIPNEFGDNSNLKGLYVPYDFGDDTYVTWEQFIKVINSKIVDLSDEFFGDDRQIGCYFVNETCLAKDTQKITKEERERFAYKVISYLWNDVAKINRNGWFKDSKTLHSAIRNFKENKDVFEDNLIADLKAKVKYQDKNNLDIS